MLFVCVCVGVKGGGCIPLPTVRDDILIPRFTCFYLLQQMPTVAMDPLIVDPLSMEHQPISMLSSLPKLEGEEDDVNVIKVKARIPSSSSSGLFCESVFFL